MSDKISQFSDNFLVNDNIIEKIKNIQTNNIQIRPNWYTNMGQFYKDYIQPNIFALIAIVILGIFLIIRYIIKKEKKRDKIKESIKIAKKIRDIPGDEKNKKDENDYLDNYIDEMIENDDYFEDDEEEEIDDEMSLQKINRYFSDLEQSGIASNLKDEYDNAMKKLNFDELAKLVSGN